MIDLAAATRRTAWLKFLQPGDAVTFVSALGKQAGQVESIGNNRIWIGLEIPGGGRISSWVWRDSGDCPSARLSIEPSDPFPRAANTVAPPLDNHPGGWEAA
jgi:hypothetical protein